MEIKMKFIGTALLALLSVGVLSALPTEKKNPLPDHSVSEVAESSTAETSCWIPLYTGEDRDWDYAAPWTSSPQEGESRTLNQDEGMKAYMAIGPSGGDLPGYAGCYMNCSGTLTVALVDPQAELLPEYAKVSETGFWIVDAQYTLEELNAAAELYQPLYDWVASHPDSKLQFDFARIDFENNRYLVELYGISLDPILEAFPDLPPCVEFLLHPVPDAATKHEIPREPKTTWTALDGILTVSVQQPEYPVGIEEITLILQNSSSSEAMYGESYSMEKYIDGTWENISGSLSFSAIGLILSEHTQQTMTISTALFPSPLGVGLYRIIGTTLSYTDETSLTTTTTDCYVVEFLVMEDAPAPTDMNLNTSDCWIPADQVISENEFHFSMKNPYAAGLQCTTEAQQDFLSINIYDRSTGEKLTASPLQFQASYPQDIHEDPQGEILVESQGQMYSIDVIDGQVTVVPSEETYDEQIPHTPRTSTETFSGEISISMEAPSYPVGTEAIAFTLTNNTQYDMTTESFLPCSELYNWEYNNCFRTLPEGATLETEIAQEPELITLKAGESKTFTLDLSQWYIPVYTEEEQEEQAALGRGLYTMTFSRRTFSFSDGSTITARLSIEFVLQ